MTDVGNGERKSAGHPSTIQTSPSGDLQTEFATYASLRRTNDETDENPYCHLRKCSYENLHDTKA